jgi:hypothetical protein
MATTYVTTPGRTAYARRTAATAATAAPTARVSVLHRLGQSVARAFQPSSRHYVGSPTAEYRATAWQLDSVSRSRII